MHAHLGQMQGAEEFNWLAAGDYCSLFWWVVWDKRLFAFDERYYGVQQEVIVRGQINNTFQTDLDQGLLF